ncbi:MAG TPA: hypothetical protein VNA04_06920 [Thermoanaerobaculia bacterium]|nr:hypothetical protein [Thermoanaerobaculia bacterium]
MRRFRSQRGEGQFGCVVGLLLLLAAIFVAYKMVPIKVKAAELRGEVVDEAKHAGSRGDDRIMKAILLKAEQTGLPVTKENVRIHRSANTIRVEVEYVVPVEFPGFTYEWSFRHVAENPIF